MRFHRILPLAALLLTANACSAQGHWAARVGAWSNELYADVAVDSQGNLYAVGEFGGNINLGATTLISQGNIDALVAKYDPNGNLLWARTFGGQGLDRAIKLALTADGQLAVTGQFMMVADFAGTILSSQAGTQDVFVLKMAQSDGAVSWVRQGGSPDGVDQPNGISVGPDGSIAVAGEFRGTAVFDQGTLTSIIDPDNNLPSVDIFLATYAADGTPQWIQQGAAEFADRGMDVVHDGDGNLYLTGQFSDTITFDQTHNNAMYSAIFIARFNAAGEEEWFRVFGGGTYNQVFEMLLVEGDRLMLVGDVQGTVIFLDTAPDLWTVDEPRSSFLVEVGLDGEFLREQNWGSQYTVNTRSLSVQDDDILVLGRFACQFTGFSDIYGDGTFLATGPHDLYVARFQLSDLAFKEAQQFGGQGDKVPGGIMHAADASPIFSGSYEHLLIFPSAGVFDANPSGGLLTPDAPTPYCADASYSSYTDLRGSALKDAFLARGYVDSREPYDIFDRSGNTCDRNLREPVIRVGNEGVLGPDSLQRCHLALLSAGTWTSFTQDTTLRHTAPAFDLLWSTGDTTEYIVIYTTGWYHLTVSFGPGCRVFTDSVFMTINPLPPQLLFNDDVVVNTNQHPPLPIEVCEPDQPWIWITGMPPGVTIAWSGPTGAVQGDSVQATISGIYTATATTPAGCIRSNSVPVIIWPVGPLDDYDVEFITNFPQDTDGNDTVAVCMEAPVICDVQVVVTLNGQPVTLPPWVLSFSSCGAGWSPLTGTSWPCTRPALTEGWYHFHPGYLLTNAPCGVDSLEWHAEDSVYVIPLPLSYPEVSLDGPALICPGDTVPLIGSCVDCVSTAWQGIGILSILNDTAWVAEPGEYLFTGNAVDTNGCATGITVPIIVEWHPQPLLAVDPLDGIICPNSTATIWSEDQGLSYQWYGPLGPLTVDNDTIVTSQQGFYYLYMVDSLGCLVSSDPILVTDYATPYLNVLPDNVLCEPGETAILQVVTTSTATLMWEDPFAGSTALQQTVTQPGIYTCHVTACGIVTELSVEILGNTANAELVDPGPFHLCADEVITLEAAPGNVLYYWYPGPVFSQQITVDTAGVYSLVVTNAVGCQDSLSISVTQEPPYAPLVVTDSTACEGEPITIAAIGDGTITWYADGLATQVITIGTEVSLGTAVNDTIVWVQQVVGQCTSDLIAWPINVYPEPIFPIIGGDTVLCEGGTLTLVTQSQPETTYTWYGPDGNTFFTGDTLVLFPVGMQHDGEWTVSASNPACGSVLISFMVDVTDAMPMSIGPDTLICPDGSAEFFLPPGFVQPVWHDASTSTSFTTGAAGAVWLTATDIYGCSVTDTALVSVFSFTQPLAPTGTTICLGQDATLFANGSGTVSWFSDQSLTNVLHIGPEWSISQPTSSATYFLQQDEGNCASDIVPVSLIVVPVPVDAQLVVPLPACEGADLVLSIIGANAPTGSWSTPSGSLQGSWITITGLTQADAGIYTVVPFIGSCAGDTLSAIIDVLVPIPFDLGADSVLCAGGSVVVNGPLGYSQFVWSTGSTSSSVTITEPGGYWLQAVDAQGCAVVDEIAFMLIECPDVIPNVVTPNGDGDNDVWILGPGPWTAAILDVYNRWGQLVWQGDALNIGFSGKHMDNGEPLSDGTYFYVLHLTRGKGRVDDLTGHLTLLR